MPKNVLKVSNNAELLSYIINVTPELSAHIDLPTQGADIKEIGKLILDNQIYRNAFINTVNLIGLTVIKRNAWSNPWDFSKRGILRFGQQVRELVNDLCNVYDYNKEFNDKTRFLKTVVPNVFNYIHEVNFQKFYQQTTSDTQMAMAFDSEGGLYDYITDAVSMMYESYSYDRYITDKYMLCRRIVDGTVTVHNITSFNTLTPRQRVSAMKNISNKMTFRSPNYNPAGVHRATNFENQILIVSTEFEAEFSTEVLATSYFKDEAEMRSSIRLIDGFDNHDTARLSELLGEAYVPFTEDELSQLADVPAVLISNQFFMDYDYSLDTANNGGLKATEFYNPTTLENNHFLHFWGVFSTSPFENACVFTAGNEPSVTGITVNPSSANATAGQTIQLSANVETIGFANKSVQWSIESGDNVSVNESGLVKLGADATGSIKIKATSVFDTSQFATATITIA